MELTATGATLEDLFRRAALGVSALMVDPAAVQAGGLRDRLRVAASDRDSLLIRWLNEIIRQLSVNRIVTASIPSLTIRRASGTDAWVLEAITDGELWDPIRHGTARKLGAAGGPGFRVEETADGWRVQGVFNG